LNKAENIYWDSFGNAKTVAKRSRTARKSGSVATADRRTAPWWLSFIIVTSIFVMLCVSINFRAFTEVREEVDQNAKLAGQIQSLQDENLALQEEIHSLKTDPKLIQQQARRIGIDLKGEKVPVPAN